MAGLGVAAPGSPLQIEGRNQLGQDGLLQVGSEVQGRDSGLDGGKEEGQGGQPLDGQTLCLGDVLACPRGQVGRLGETCQARPNRGEAGGDLRQRLDAAVLQVVGVKQDPQFTDRRARLALTFQGLGLLDLRLDPIAHGHLDPGREGRGPAAGTRRLRRVGPRGRPLRIEVRLRDRDRGAGLLDLAGQVQSGALGDLLLAMEEIRDMLGAAVFLEVAAQRLGLVAGALHNRDRQPRQRRLQGLRPGRRGAVRRLLLQQNAVRDWLDGHQADCGVEGFVLADRHLARWHVHSQCGPQFLRRPDHRLLPL